MLAGLGCLVPVGLLLVLSGAGLLIGGPFLLVGIGLIIMAILGYSVEIWKDRRTIPFYCPYCDHRQRVRGKSASYSCKKCGNLVIVKTAEDVKEDESQREGILRFRERVPFARIVLSYNEARQLEAEGRLREALEIYLDNIRSDEKVSVGHYERAVSILEKQGKIEEALELAQTARTIRYPQRTLREYADRVFSKKIARLEKKLKKAETR